MKKPLMRFCFVLLSFRQLDKLGICASHGIEVMVRQTLLGPGHRNGRRLITDDYDPNPVRVLIASSLF